MRKLGSAAAVALTGVFLAVSLGGQAGARSPGARAFVPTDIHRAQTDLTSAEPRVLKSGHPVRHYAPPVAPFQGPGTPPRVRFTEAPVGHPVPLGQLRPASFAFSLYPTGPPLLR
jgi:hypothetical protein